MPKRYKFNGMKDGKPVKIVVTLKEGYKKQVEAFPKEDNVDTPHFQKYKGIWSVHQDSPDHKYYRVMENPITIASGTFSVINNYVKNSGLDLLILPTQETADGVIINTNPDGVEVIFPSGVSGQTYYFALGKLSGWKRKPCHNI